MRTIPIILFGTGGVGRALLRQILAHRTFHANTYGLTLRVVALCDSNGAVLATQGLGDQDLQALLDHKATGGRLADHPLGDKQNNPAAIVEMAAREGAIVVDCTATADTVSALTVALARGCRIVLANKKPLTVDQEIYTRLTSAPVAERRRGETIDPPVRHLGRARWETTVGAGLPVIVTLNRLVASGDPVLQITGTFSGTLGYVMTGLGQGRPLPQQLRLPSAPQPAILYDDRQDRPQPRLDRLAGTVPGMATVVGRLRPDPLFHFKFLALGHNTIRGAAGGSILNAELLVAQGFLGLERKAAVRGLQLA